MLYLRAVGANGSNVRERPSSTMQIFGYGCIPVGPAPSLLALYSPNLVEGKFSEVGMQDAAYPARWPPYGRPETSQLLNVDHYMLHVRTELRSGQYAVPRQDADAGKGRQEFRGAVHYGR